MLLVMLLFLSLAADPSLPASVGDVYHSGSVHLWPSLPRGGAC